MNEQTSFESTESTRNHRRSRGWIGGVMLIALGLLLLLQNLTGFSLHNWWALFILLPAVGAFTAAWNTYQEAGRVTAAVRASLFGGAVLCLVSASFLFSLNWAIVGPALLLLAGAALLINDFLPH
jgi:cation transport ATPase